VAKHSVASKAPASGDLAPSVPTAESAPSATAPDRPRGRRVRRRWLALLVGLLAIGAVVALQVPQWLFPAPTKTVWQEITAGIQDGTVPKQTALQAFAYVYKVNIPGVTVPQGRDDSDKPTSGSGVMRWVQANWDGLTPDQQAVINRYLVTDPSYKKIEASQAPGATTSPAAVTSGGAAKPEFRLLSIPKYSPINLTMAPDSPPDLSNAMAVDLAADIARLGPELGMPVITPGSLALPNIELIMSDVDGAGALLETHATMLFGHYEPCEVTAYKNAWQNEQVTGSGGISDALHAEITHEAVHCYQRVIWGSLATANQIPSWIVEGTALYLAAMDTGITEPMVPSTWRNHYLTPEQPLTDRSYDAIGYYSLLTHEGRGLWGLMRPAWQAAAAATTGPERSNAFIAVLNGDGPDIRNNWAASYLREGSWNDPWVMYGPGLPADAKVIRHDAKAEPAPGQTGSLLARSNTVLNVSASSGEVVTVTTDGLASVHDNSGNFAVAFQTQSFCTVAGGCVCPQGTLLQGKDVTSLKLTIPFVAAFNAPSGGSTYSIVANKLDDLCKRAATPAPKSSGPSKPCGTSCTSSNGDPHMLTVSQQNYAFQAAGEFTLLRSTDGSVDIQARQEPYKTSGHVSINTAIAAKAGSHRVGVYVTDAGLQPRVNGAIVDLSAGPKDLGGGALISAIGNGFEIDFPDGTKVWALSVGQYGINVQIRPSDGLKASGVGLLGAVIPGGMGLPALPDGTRLPAATDAQQRHNVLYGQFADAWRVTDSTTLFDYDSGKSTASYTDKSYPADTKDLALTDLTSDQQAAGNSACSAITDAGLHDNCVFDVGVTGQTGFADGYGATQTFYDSGIVAPTVSTAPATPAPSVVSGAVTVTGATGLGGYAIGPDNTVYLSVQTGTNKYSLISFDPKAGTILKQVDVPRETSVHYAAGSVWLPGLKTDATGDSCSITRFDAGTLTELATIPVPCTAFYTAGPIASDGAAIWFVDDSKYDSSTNKGGVIARIDPQTNAPGASVPLPSENGYLADSQGAVFYSDSKQNYYRLTTGSTTLDSLGTLSSGALPAGTGLWVQSSGGKSAQYVTQAGAPQATLQIDGGLLGGDASAAYIEVGGYNAAGVSENQLWRYPIDGSTPTQIASAPMIDGSPLDYSGSPLLISNANGVLKIWTINNGTTPPVLLQWTPLH
jgi:hypothetical protein